MPNWCYNHLEVSGDEIQLREFVEKSLVKNEHKDDNFSFNGTYPMPKDLNITKGTQTQDEKEQAKLNIELYGYASWYDWSVENWGTKWDACESHIHHNDINYFSVSFDTAWSPPINWIDNIMQDFPDLCFTLEHEEPGMCFGGQLTAQYETIWEDAHWDVESAAECCEGPINWEHKELEQQCLICGEETETITMNVADIKPAKIKTDETVKN